MSSKLKFDLVEHLQRQREFSLKTFGPDPNIAGIVKHIRKECMEIELNPDDIFEWIDVIILAFDGAMRRGFTDTEIASALAWKQSENEKRKWPPFGSVSLNEPIEHIREEVNVPDVRSCDVPL